MATKTTERYENISQLLVSLGDIPGERVLLRPSPGTATEADLLERRERRMGLPCELIDGVLVEKAMGLFESFIALEIAFLIHEFLDVNDLGIVVGEAAMMRMLPGIVRAPDVSFIHWDKLPGRLTPAEPIPALYPDLAIEVLSQSNTAAEMERKLGHYFLAGVRLVWQIDPAMRTVSVHSPAGSETTLTDADTLDGGDVLPGLAIPVAALFRRVPKKPASSKRQGRSKK